nr:MAG TPA: hypothetical protein [Caudoviricetes sp.]
MKVVFTVIHRLEFQLCARSGICSARDSLKVDGSFAGILTHVSRLLHFANPLHIVNY